VRDVCSTNPFVSSEVEKYASPTPNLRFSTSLEANGVGCALLQD
jgi:hypothetical protein